ncbi:hypothetical protein ACLOJK_033823 [Asimina triloba]
MMLRFTDTGFTVNGVDYQGSLLIVDKLLMSWSPKTFSEITPDRCSVPPRQSPSGETHVMSQGTEILILGCGRNIQHVDPELRRFIRSTGMKLEVLDSRNAASTFNILTEEGRLVAGALLPYGVSS